MKNVICSGFVNGLCSLNICLHSKLHEPVPHGLGDCTNTWCRAYTHNCVCIKEETNKKYEKELDKIFDL